IVHSNHGRKGTQKNGPRHKKTGPFFCIMSWENAPHFLKDPRRKRGSTKIYLSVVSPARAYSAFSRAILVIDISLGHTASQAPVEVQLPNPSLSICAIISTTRVFRSGLPCGNNARCETLAHLALFPQGNPE